MYINQYSSLLEEIQLNLLEGKFDTNDVINIFKEISDAFNEDYNNCDNCQGMKDLASNTSFAYIQLKKSFLSNRNIISFKKQAISQIEKIASMLDK